jgi:alanine or glycine:cation symporter, AGCS family
MTFNLLYCMFVIIGSAMNLSAVIDFADAAVFAMALVNIAGLYVLMPVVKQEMESFLARVKSGEIRKTRH